MTLQKISISNELKNLLIEIKDCLVAQLLLKGEHPIEDLADDFVNFISISKKDLTKISYLPKERSVALTEEECFLTSKRVMAKPGGFVSKVFKNIPEKEVEKFSTLFRSEATKPKLNFKVVDGDEIKAYYLYSSYADRNGGSLHASCMKHGSCQNFLDIYTKNPDVCKMVLLFDSKDFCDEYYDETKIVGRALLWNVNGHKLMDRIYTINDEMYQFYFKQWATKNGYLFKTQQNWFNTKFFEKLGEDKQKIELSLDLKNKSFDYVPYMDTFKFVDYNGVLYNYQPEGRDYYTLTDTGGRKNGFDHLVTDFFDDVLRYRGEAIKLRYLGDGKWTHPDNCRYSEIMDCYIYRGHCVRDESISDWIYTDEYESFNDRDRINDRVERIKQRDEERRIRRERRERNSGDEIDWRLLFHLARETRTDVGTTSRLSDTSSRTRHRSYDLDFNYLNDLRNVYNDNYGFVNSAATQVVDHILNYINNHYSDIIEDRRISNLIRSVSERVSYSFLRGTITNGDIHNMIETDMIEILRSNDRFSSSSF